MIEFKPQNLRDIARAMYQSIERFDAADEHDKADFINPDAPVIVQLGDFGYEVFSIGGDPNVEGFVMMLKPGKVCQWKGIDVINLKANK